MSRKSTLRAAWMVACTAALVFAPGATAASTSSSSDLREAVTVEEIMGHLQEFQAIADANGDTRSAGTPGYDESGAYIEEQLAQHPGYFDVRRDTFKFDLFHIDAAPSFAQSAPTAQTFVDGTDFDVMDYSGDSSLTGATVVPTNDIVIPPGPDASSSSSGCELTDFVAAPDANSVALIQRGTCDFGQKAVNAAAAGYAGAIIFNEGQADLGRDGLLFGTLGDFRPGIGTVGTTFALGEAMYNAIKAGQVVKVDMSIATSITEDLETFNVIADTTSGRTDRTVVVGAHLDSVPEGPGINDNGSGSAAQLETALEMAENGVSPRNRVRFAWWGAEEEGLVGSQAYVDELTKRQIKDIAVNLNFDMVGSPNYGRFVYDGDASDTDSTGSTGSGVVEDVFVDYFDGQGLGTAPTAFDGRSDYDAFVAAGIPAGGLFTGAEQEMTAELNEIFQIDDAILGDAFDECYHQACDTIDNIDQNGLDEMSDAIAHGVWSFAQTTSAVEGTDKGSANGKYDPERMGEAFRK